MLWKKRYLESILKLKIYAKSNFSMAWHFLKRHALDMLSLLSKQNAEKSLRQQQLLVFKTVVFFAEGCCIIVRHSKICTFILRDQAVNTYLTFINMSKCGLNGNALVINRHHCCSYYQCIWCLLSHSHQVLVENVANHHYNTHTQKGDHNTHNHPLHLADQRIWR